MQNKGLRKEYGDSRFALEIKGPKTANHVN